MALHRHCIAESPIQPYTNDLLDALYCGRIHYRKHIGGIRVDLPDLAAIPERSIVTIVVIDTVGSTEHIASLDPDDAQALLDDVFQHIRKTVEKAGGLMVSFFGDGGVAVFGWPSSQEDHADRACEAAWETQHPSTIGPPLLGPDGTPIKFRIGIHSGLVGLRQQHLEGGANLDLVGGTIHLAAALEKRAPPGEILVSSTTLKQCRNQMQLKDYEGFPALDKLPATVHLVCARPHRMTASDMIQRHRLPMLGRDAEREKLKAMLPQRGGANHVAAIIGEPGIGKSRLATSLLRDAKSMPISVNRLVFQGDMLRSSTPYAAMRALIAQALEISEHADSTELQEAILDGVYLPTESNDLSELLTFWENVNGEKDTPESPPKFSQSLVELFTIFAIREPLLIVVEDLHNIDPESVNCFRILSVHETAYPFMLLLTGRPKALPIAQQITDDIIQLSRMSPGLMLEMARQVSPNSEAQDALLRKAVERADGIPFFLEELVTGLDKKGLDQKLPDTVHTVIHARLNNLSAATKITAQALSVLGETIELSFAQRTLNMSAKDLQDGLAELESNGLIHPPLGHIIQFRHALISESCATTVHRNIKIDLHKSAIKTLESNATTTSDYLARIAFHAEEAQLYTLALDYLWQAALKASRSWANGSLQLIFDRAVRCIDKIGPEADEKFLDFMLVAYTPMLQMGEFARMDQHLGRATEVARSLKLPHKLCGMLCQSALLHWFEGQYIDGQKDALQAVSMAEEMNSLPHIFAAKFSLAINYHGLSQINDSLKTMFGLVEQLDVLPLTARLGSAAIPSSISRAYISWFLMEVGRYEEGLQYAIRAIEIALNSKDPYTEVLARLGHGRNLLKLQRNEEAEETLRIAHNIAASNGFFPAAIHISGLLASALARLGESKLAVKITDNTNLHSRVIRCGGLQYFYFYAGRAEALFRDHQQEKAIAAIDTALSHASRIRDHGLLMQGYGLKADFLLAHSHDDPEGLLCRKRQEDLAAKYGLVV